MLKINNVKNDMHKKKIYISGFYGSRNKGDLLMLLGLLGFIRDRLSVDVTVSTLYNPKIDKNVVPKIYFVQSLGTITNLSDKFIIFLSYYFLKLVPNKFGVSVVKTFSPDYRKSITEIANSHMLITTGGPFALETTKLLFGMKISSFNYTAFLLELLVAKSLNIPYAVLGQSFGSLHTMFGKSNFKFILESSTFIYSRESGGVSLLRKSLNLKKEILILPDLAFYSKIFSLSDIDNINIEEKVKNTKYAVINVRFMSLKELQYLFDTDCTDENILHERYFLVVSDIIHFLYTSHKFTFFVFFNQAVINDGRAAKRVITKTNLPYDMFWSTPDNLSIESMISLFKKSEFALTTRYHSLIISLITKKPVCPICYNPKISYLLDDIKINVPCLSGEQFTCQFFMTSFCKSLFLYDSSLVDDASTKLKNGLHDLFDFF